MELCEGLVEIGYRSFGWCDLSIRKLINIPNSLRRICNYAFYYSLHRRFPRQGMSTSNASDVFIYTGEGGAEVPQNVVRVLVDSSVTWIPAFAFDGRKSLAEVKLCEDWGRFLYCDHSITKIIIPNSLRRINDNAFQYSLRCPIRLHDDIESIGQYAFGDCIFTNFRVPLITVIPKCMLSNCRATFSLELSENVTEIENYAFSNCYCLRNVAFPPNAVIDDNIFCEGSVIERSDLQELFGSEAAIISELQHRFDELHIHKLVYYQSYNQGVLQMLIAAMNRTSDQHRTSMLDPTGNQQDFLA